MEIPRERESQQITFNHSPGIDFQDFMNFYKKCTVKPFFLIDDIPASNNSSSFRKNFWERIQKLIIKTHDKI